VSFLVRWLGGSFAKLGFSVGLCGFANVPPNALAFKFVFYTFLSKNHQLHLWLLRLIKNICHF
jgi:hypothetical protein